MSARQKHSAIANPHIIFHDGFCARAESSVSGALQRTTLSVALIDAMVVVSDDHATAHEHVIANANIVGSGNMYIASELYIVTYDQGGVIVIADPVVLDCFEP